MTPRTARWSALDLAEGFQLAHAVSTLHDLGVLRSLARPATVRALARRHRVDAALLAGALAFVAARSDLIERRGARFVATEHYAAAARYLIDLYLGAFGASAALLARSLRDPAPAETTVDRRRHARAFAEVDGALGPVPGVIHQLGLGAVLDLGCGAGALLIALAAHDPGFVGWGIERSRAMCVLARRKVRAAKLGRRVRILAGDATARGAVPAAVAAAVRTVTMCDVANEMFGDGRARFAAWLRALRLRLPGRLLIVSDYYGRLGTSLPGDRETLLQDYAQVISGQGVPPAGLRAWQAIYRRARCQLIHAIEDVTTTRFLHVVRLAPPSRRLR